MGSSKKHKDKDREHKKKKRHRSRSRSRSRERKHRREDGGHERKHKRDRSRHSPGDYDDGSNRHPEDVKPIKTDPAEYAEPQSSGGGGGGDISLSVGETNKLREKLGLKPLDVGGQSGAGDESKPKASEDVHVPAKNLGQIKKSESIREKMAAIKEKRRINKKLGKVKTLGDSESEDDDMLTWITKSRKSEQEKKMAAQRAKMLEEMDEEFGIGDLVDEAFASKKKPDYSSRDLKGLKVRHKEDDFEEGDTVILTLEDKRILDDDGDELHNVNMVDMERTRKNLENKKKKKEYNPYDEAHFGDDGMLQNKDILSKYDEEIKGAKKESFQLGAGGRYHAEHEKALRKYKQDLKESGDSLVLPAPNLAREFYTDQEMEKFKKFKKKTRKIRKKPKAVKADDLMPLEPEVSQDFGRRGRGRVAEEVRVKEEPVDDDHAQDNGAIPGLDLVEDMELDDQDPLGEAEILGPDEDLTGVVIDDDAGNELQSVLAKTRRIKQKKKRHDPESIVVEHVNRTGVQTGEDDETRGAFQFSSNPEEHTILLDSTSEFCRVLGEIPTYGQAGNRPEEEEDELIDFEKDLVEQRRRQAEEDEGAGGWQAVEIDTAPVDIRDEDHTALEEEPVVDAGLATALSLAKKKGFLVKEQNKRIISSGKHIDLENSNYSIEDKRYDDLDDKYKRRDRFGGGLTQDFKELDGYKPKVKLQYVDETGRNMNEKEAFRQLSHRFHGKGSGKKKIEKRTRKIEQETLLISASSSDTPLGTVALLRQKQKMEQTPFVVLSGNKSTGGNIAKT